ncbi:hypothetical protein HRbin16_00292 [bacterium HR16]|nr:hypothetical protein HRbin16_00292 [bacterium HR16]
MARRLLIAFVLALLPVVAVVVHPELRRVWRQDVTLAFTGEVEVLSLPTDGEQKKAILELETRAPQPDHLTKAREYVQLYERFRQPYLLGAAVRSVTLRSLFPFSMPEPPQSAEERLRYARELLSISEKLTSIDRQNAFPYLMKMVAHASLGERQKALEALREAAGRSVYNGYEREWLRMVSSRRLTAEERLIAAGGLLFPHFAQLRNAFERTRQWANEMEVRGHHRESLQVADWMMRCGELMRHAGDSVIQAFVGAAIERIAWQRKLSPKRPTDPPKEEYRRLAEQFGNYARQHNRQDLAKRAVASVDTYENFQQAFTKVSEAWEDRLNRLFGMRAGGFVLQIWVWTWLFCVAATLLLSPLWHFSRTVQDSILPWTAAIPFAGVLIAVSVAAGLSLYPFAEVFQQLAGPLYMEQPNLTRFSLREHAQSFRQLAAAAPCALAVVCFALPLYRLTRQLKAYWVTGSAVLGLLLALSIFSSGAAVPYSLGVYEDVFHAVLAFLIAVTGLAGLVASPFYAFLLRKPLPVPLRAGIAALWGLMSIVAWTGFLTETALWLAVGLVLWLIWGRSLPEDARLETQRAVYRFGMSALILAVLGLWLYAILGYASLPARAQQHAYLDQLIEHGEMSLLQQFSK